MSTGNVSRENENIERAEAAWGEDQRDDVPATALEKAFTGSA